MTARGHEGGGDELDDPGLRSMRAVWLSMHEEEPPSAGLAELLAAARVKAEEMKPREPWWQRVFAVMRRPPVLALATAVVLLGGAVVIGGRREALEATPTIEAERGRGGAAPAKLEAAPSSVVEAATEAEAAKDTAASAGSAAAPEGAAAKEATPAAKVAVRPGAQPQEAPADRPRPAVIAGAGPSAADRDGVAEEPAERLAPPPPPAPKGAGAAKKLDLPIADDSGAAGEVQQEAAAGGARLDAARADGADRTHASTVEQLAKQAEVAAARGDCAAVRAIVDRIRKLDAARGKAHVERSAAVKRCLP